MMVLSSGIDAAVKYSAVCFTIVLQSVAADECVEAVNDATEGIKS